MLVVIRKTWDEDALKVDNLILKSPVICSSLNAKLNELKPCYGTAVSVECWNSNWLQILNTSMLNVEAVDGSIFCNTIIDISVYDGSILNSCILKSSNVECRISNRLNIPLFDGSIFGIDILHRFILIDETVIGCIYFVVQYMTVR